MSNKLHYWDYLKSAFWNRWNMLGLFTASAASVIMGIPDIALPIVAAAEILFLVSVAGNPIEYWSNRFCN